MTATETQYFALLRAALWGTPVAVDGPIDWKAVMRIAVHHGNNGLIADVAAKMTPDMQPAPEALAKMKAELRSNLFNQMQLRKIMVSAVKLLREHDIEPVLLKGFSLAMLYPNPNLRQFGDVDLFIGLENFHAACAVLRTMPGSYNWGEEVDSGHQYNIEFGQYPMEVHRVSADVTDPEEHERYAAIERDGLFDHTRRVNLDGFEVTLPSEEFMVFYTFFHAWHHFITSGAGWRQVTDVALTLHAYHDSLDRDKLRQWLNAMHLMQPWQTFGYLMVQQLGLPEAEMPFYDASARRRAQRLYSQIMAEGNFKRNSRFKQRKPRGASFGRKIHSFVGIFVDYFHVAKVFPDAAARTMRTSLKAGMRKNLSKQWE